VHKEKEEVVVVQEKKVEVVKEVVVENDYKYE
jgi:hypothetical protein